MYFTIQNACPLIHSQVFYHTYCMSMDPLKGTTVTLQLRITMTPELAVVMSIRSKGNSISYVSKGHSILWWNLNKCCKRKHFNIYEDILTSRIHIWLLQNNTTSICRLNINGRSALISLPKRLYVLFDAFYFRCPCPSLCCRFLVRTLFAFLHCALSGDGLLVYLLVSSPMRHNTYIYIYICIYTQS